MISVNTSLDDLIRVVKLANNMASYAHHAGFPVYDGGHSEPEGECQHEDCKAVRNLEILTQNDRVIIKSKATIELENGSK